MKHVAQTAAKIKDAARRFIREEDGVGVVEIILILVVLVGLVIVFQNEIGDIVDNALDAFSDDASSIYD